MKRPAAVDIEVEVDECKQRDRNKMWFWQQNKAGFLEQRNKFD